MSEPEGSEAERPRDYLSPSAIIDAARKADPNFRFAIVAAGLLAIVVIIANFGVNYATLIFGVIALVALMVLYLIFSQVRRLRSSSMDWPALALVWTVMCAVITIVVLLTTSTFFDWPLPFKSWIVRHIEVSPDANVVSNGSDPSPPPPTPEPVVCKVPSDNQGGQVGWVFYGVQQGKPTTDGRLVPPNGAPMPAFGGIRDRDILEAMEPVRMYDGPGRDNRLLLKVGDGACVRALPGRKLHKQFGSYSAGWVCSQEAECPSKQSSTARPVSDSWPARRLLPTKRQNAARPNAEPRDGGSQNCTISNTTNAGSIVQNCSR